MTSSARPNFYNVILYNMTSYCDIETLLALRHVNQATRSLLLTYEQSICFSAATRYEFDDAAFCRERGKTTYKGLATGWRYRDLIMFLNKRIVALSGYYLINLNAIDWAPFCQYLERAFYLMIHFSEIGWEIQRAVKSEQSRKQGPTSKLATVIYCEEKILQARLDFLETLPLQDLMLIDQMFFVLFCANCEPADYRRVHEGREILAVRDCSLMHWLPWYKLQYGLRVYAEAMEKPGFSDTPCSHNWRIWQEAEVDFHAEPKEIAFISIKAVNRFYQRFYERIDTEEGLEASEI